MVRVFRIQCTLFIVSVVGENKRNRNHRTTYYSTISTTKYHTTWSLECWH